MSFFLAAAAKLLERLGPYLRGPAGKALADKVLDSIEDWADDQGKSSLLTVIGAIRYFGDIPDGDDGARAMAGSGPELASEQAVLDAIDDLGADE